MNVDLPRDHLPVPFAADIRRAAALLLHVAGPQRDREGLYSVLAAADTDGRTAELVLAVVRLTRGLCDGPLRPEAVPALQRVALHGALIEAEGLSGPDWDGPE